MLKNPDSVRSGRTCPATLGVQSCPFRKLICPVRLSPRVNTIHTYFIQGYENNTYFERICHTRIVFDMPFEKRFVCSKMWDPVGTRFLILWNKPPNFNFAFAWRKKKSEIRNEKSEIRWQNHKSKLKQWTTWFQLCFASTRKNQIQKSEIRYVSEFRNQKSA